MSKTLKKSLSILSVLVILIMSVFVLSACGKDAKFEVSSNVKTNTDAVINNLVENVYNNKTDLGTKTTYSAAEVQEKIDGFTYYVELGTMSNIDDIKSISFGNLTFNADQTFNLSIGKIIVRGDKIWI